MCSTHYGKWRLQSMPACSVEDCQHPASTRGMCRTHYSYWNSANQLGLCSEEGCDDPVKSKGFCSRHYIQHWKQNVRVRKSCNVDGCDKPADSKGMCSAHYAAKKRASQTKQCTIEGCTNKLHINGLCGSHYKRKLKYGDPLAGRPAYRHALRYLQETVLTYEGDDCLIWPYAKTEAGYGHIEIKGRSPIVSRLI